MTDKEIAFQQRVALGAKRRNLDEQMKAAGLENVRIPKDPIERAEWLRKAREDARAKRIQAVFDAYGL